MDMNLQAIGQTFAIYALPVLFAITLHEAAHGYVARHFGDMTAHAQGRISLNPIRHVDLLGTVVVPLIILVLSSGKLLFGWAKPVPVNYSALRKPRPHMAWVAAAGPIANLAMALVWALAPRAAWRFAKLEPWGVPLVLALLFVPVHGPGSNALATVLSPLLLESEALVRAMVLL